MSQDKKVAMVLAGCGVYDGSEIQETVFAMTQLSKLGAKVEYFAPNIDQMHVINHMKGEEMTPPRNVMIEASRITRGQMKDIVELKASDFDALICPGGFGAAKNLSDVAVKGPDMTVQAEVSRVIKEFHAAGKAQGFCCIAPALPAKTIEGCEVTLGGEEEGTKWPYAGTVGAVKAVGATHVPKSLSECHIDKKNKVVSSPAYMCGDAPIHEIEESVQIMVKETLALA